MNFTYKKEANIEVGQKLYGIIAVSRMTYDGMYPVIVDRILWDDEEVVFKVDQSCGYVSCMFDEMEDYVFESEEEANTKLKILDFGVGMFAY